MVPRTELVAAMILASRVAADACSPTAAHMFWGAASLRSQRAAELDEMDTAYKLEKAPRCDEWDGIAKTTSVAPVDPLPQVDPAGMPRTFFCPSDNIRSRSASPPMSGQSDDRLIRSLCGAKTCDPGAY
jgi:hypothetical protein